jgi:pimeloyl-ACP methyl ester carboxylesterase
VTAPTEVRTITSILATLATFAILLASCGSPETPAPPTESRPITFESEDGVALAGRLFGPEGANAGVVLAHMYPADQSSWYRFADRLAGDGYRVVTFDFRGYCPGGDAGCSQGEKRVADMWQDVLGAMQTLRDEGVTRIGLIGASMGGTASLVAASREGEDVEAIVTLSAPTSFEGLEAGPDAVSQVTGAKLFIAGHADVPAAEAVDVLYGQALQPKRPVILTTDDHGTDILSGNQSGIATTEILRWLDRYLPVAA